MHLRVFMLGNSLTDDIRYNGFQNIVAEAGHTLALGTQRVPGASISYLWSFPTQGFTHSPFGTYPNAFANYEWDAITLQPTSTGYAAQLSAGRSFARALRGDGTFGPGTATTPEPGDPTGISPNATVYVYAQQPPNLLGGWNSDYWLYGSAEQYKTRAYFEEFYRQLRDSEPESTIRLIPVGHVFHELNMRMRAGQLPGVTHQSDWLIDNSHASLRGSYVIALTFFATLFGEDPSGQAPVSPYQVNSALAAVIQDAVWTVVSRHPWTGRAQGLVITEPSLTDAVEDEPYSHQLHVAQEEGVVTWSIVEGSLPPGLALSPSGLLSGTTSEVGYSAITFRAEDSEGNFDERPLFLFILSNDPPIITTGTLPQGRVGKPYHLRLERESGVGEVEWSVFRGDLPHGVELSPEGLITGVPLAVPGDYWVTIAAQDATGAEAQVTLNLILSPPEDGTLIAAPVLSPPVLDGILNDPAWSTMLKVDANAGPDGPEFGVRWDEEAIYFGVAVEGSGDRLVSDAVHLFVDGLHTKQQALNANDRHIVIHSDGSWEERNGRPDGVEVATHEHQHGWSVEVKLPFSNLERVPGRQSLSVGFDVAVTIGNGNSEDTVAYSLFGASMIDPIPAHMGNLALLVAPLANDLVVNGDFSSGLQAQSWPGAANMSMVNEGWKSDGVGSRTFARLDGTNYGFPRRSIVPYGDAARSTYQLIQDDHATTGPGFLRFDIKYASPNISYRLFGYNGSPEDVGARMNVRTADHPIHGGSPNAILLQGNLADLPEVSSWREVALPVDFGQGYDYLVLALGATQTGIHIDSRVDNVQLGAMETLLMVDGSEPPTPDRLDTLVHVDFRGTHPSRNRPWTQVYSRHPAVVFSGLQIGSGIVPENGNDAFVFSQNHGGPDLSTLEHAMSNHQYLEFTLTSERGTMDLAGGVLQLAVDRMDERQNSQRLSVFSSVSGFSDLEDAILMTPTITRSSVEPFAVALPNTDAYRNLESITFRIYTYRGTWTRKPFALVGLGVGGIIRSEGVVIQDPEVQALYDAWRGGINWHGRDSSMAADASGDGISNLLAFVMAFPDPTAPATRELLPFLAFDPEEPGPPTIRFRFRRRAHLQGLGLDPQISSDLIHWSSVEGSASFRLIDADHDGDGAAELWEVELPVPPGEATFLRLRVGPSN